MLSSNKAQNQHQTSPCPINHVPIFKWFIFISNRLNYLWYSALGSESLTLKLYVLGLDSQHTVWFALHIFDSCSYQCLLHNNNCVHAIRFSPMYDERRFSLTGQLAFGRKLLRQDYYFFFFWFRSVSCPCGPCVLAGWVSERARVYTTDEWHSEDARSNSTMCTHNRLRHHSHIYSIYMVRPTVFWSSIASTSLRVAYTRFFLQLNILVSFIQPIAALFSRMRNPNQSVFFFFWIVLPSIVLWLRIGIFFPMNFSTNVRSSIVT